MATVLIVDHERPVRDLLARVVRERGHRPLQAIDGRHALQVFASEKCDLVIADALMPLVDRNELCRRLKAKGVPVILMCADGPQAANASGVDALIEKPFDLDEIESVVRRVLAAARSAGRTRKGDPGKARPAG